MGHDWTARAAWHSSSGAVVTVFVNRYQYACYHAVICPFPPAPKCADACADASTDAFD